MIIVEWTKEEEQILFDNYVKYGSEYCSNILNRGRNAIIHRAKILGLKYNRVKKIYLEENLRPLVESSNGIAQVLDKLNLRKAGGNYQVINKYIDIYNIDISHFETSEERFEKMINDFVKIPIDKVLVENSSYSRTSLKDRLYKEGYMPRKCCLCGQSEIWNGMRISLILDHINGIHNDNRLCNLRILCPNCNAGQDTFAGRNTKRKIESEYIVKTKDKIIKEIKYNGTKITTFFCICGEKMNKESKKCTNCFSYNRRKVERPPYDQLLKEIESTNYSEVGRKYGVSDNSIRKWIKHYEKLNNNTIFTN